MNVEWTEIPNWQKKIEFSPPYPLAGSRLDCKSRTFGVMES